MFTSLMGAHLLEGTDLYWYCSYWFRSFPSVSGRVLFFARLCKTMHTYICRNATQDLTVLIFDFLQILLITHKVGEILDAESRNYLAILCGFTICCFANLGRWFFHQHFFGGQVISGAKVSSLHSERQEALMSMYCAIYSTFWTGYHKRWELKSRK